jgi:hypothetical protein
MRTHSIAAIPADGSMSSRCAALPKSNSSAAAT